MSEHYACLCSVTSPAVVAARPNVATIITLAQEKGFDVSSAMAGVIVSMVKEDEDLGCGHAMTLVQVV